MLYKLSELFPVVPWTVFKYVTFRSAGAAITALLLSWILGPRVIEGLRNLKFRQDYQPKDVRNPSDATAAAADLAKRGTPTMGGVLILLVLDISVFLWARPNTLVLLTMLS
jgi:phospho-N-acetylmuramoyl-pentapeptide-transferase